MSDPIFRLAEYEKRKQAQQQTQQVAYRDPIQRLAEREKKQPPQVVATRRPPEAYRPEKAPIQPAPPPEKVPIKPQPISREEEREYKEREKRFWAGLEPPKKIRGLSGERYELYIPSWEERWDIGPKEPIELLEPEYLYPLIVIGAVAAPTIKTIPIVKKVATWVGKKPQAWLTKRYLAKGPAKWGLPEKIVMKLTGARPYMPPSEVVLPKTGMYAMETLPYSYGFKKVEATKLAWELMQTPRTAGVWVAQTGKVAPRARVLPTLFTAGEFVVKLPGVSEPVRWIKPTPEEMAEPLSYVKYKYRMGVATKTYFERAIWPEKGLLPLTTQTQLTRMGIYPDIGKTAAVTGKAGVMLLPAIGITPITRIVRRPKTPKRRERRKVLLVPKPKLWQPTWTYEREKFRPLTFLEPKVKKRERLVPALKMPIPTTQIQPQIPKQVVTPKPVQRERGVLVPKIPPPTILKPPTPMPTPIIPPFYWRRRGGRDVSRLGRTFWGKWFKREHKLPTAKEMACRFGLAMPKTRRRKKRRVKRKGGVPKLRF